MCIDFDVWNDNLTSLECSGKFAFCFKIHLDLYSSNSCLFSFVWMGSSQTKTCFVFKNLSWLGCLHTKFVWQWPSLCLPLFLSAPGYKHWKQKPFFFSSENRYFGVISTNVLHEKNWIILVWFGPIVATWSLCPQNEQTFWVFSSAACGEPLYPFLLSNSSYFLLGGALKFVLWIKLLCWCALASFYRNSVSLLHCSSPSNSSSLDFVNHLINLESPQRLYILSKPSPL